jgi:hypothetical protein
MLTVLHGVRKAILPACFALLCGAAQPQAAAPPAAQSPGAQPPRPESQAGQPDWKSYNFTDEGFSALFPSQPVKQKQNIPADKITLELRSYTVETPSLALEVVVCDFGDAIHDSDSDGILQGAKNGAVTSANAHLLTARKITLGIYPGIAFEAEADQLHLSARIYLVGTTLYQTFVSRPIDQANAESSKFLDSFQLIPRPAP